MKKKIIKSLVLVTLVGSAVIGIGTNVKAENAAYISKQNNSSNVSSDDSSSAQVISKEEAKQIAFEHAGVKETDTTDLKVTTDMEDKVFVYEVEFNVGTKEYDYDIHATNGNIISFDVEHEDVNKNTITSNDSSNNSDDASADVSSETVSNSTVSNQAISEDEAKRIALDHARVKEAEIKNLRIKLDSDDKTPEYEIEFHVSNKEYDFEIDAQSGNVIEWDVETVDAD